MLIPDGNFMPFDRQIFGYAETEDCSYIAAKTAKWRVNAVSSRIQTQKLLNRIMRIAELLAKAEKSTTKNKLHDKQTNQSS